MTLRHFVTPAVMLGFQLSTIVGASGTARAQAPAGDTLRLAELQTAAAQRDPRARQLDLLAVQSDLRLRSIRAERLPALTVSTLAQYQSDVTAFPLQLQLPGGVRPAVPPKDRYDARIDAEQSLIDPSVGTRRAVERAQLAESQARVRTAIYGLRENVDDAFFSAARLQLERGEVETSITDLEAQLRVASDRVRLGSALPSEAATLQAEILLRRQVLAEIDANRRAALVVLSDLTGIRIEPGDVLDLPEVAAAVARARATMDEARDRPEYAQFARSRELLQHQERAVSARDKPRVAAFAQAGYGRPGLNVLNTSFDSYWIGGVQVRWTPWSWGTTRRERDLLALQRQIVDTEEAAFRDRLERASARDLATVDRLESAIATDDQIIALRERIARETLRRFQEGVVTSAEYVDRQTDVLNARLARASHRAELAQARSRFLTLVGAEVRR